jgi:hypothetical protein
VISDSAEIKEIDEFNNKVSKVGIQKFIYQQFNFRDYHKESYPKWPFQIHDITLDPSKCASIPMELKI